MTGGQSDTITTVEELEAAWRKYDDVRKDVASRTDSMRANSLLLAGAGLANDVKSYLDRPDRPAYRQDQMPRAEYEASLNAFAETSREAQMGLPRPDRPTGVSREQVEALIALVQGSPTVDRKCAGDGTADLHYIVCADEFDLAVLGLHPEEE